MARKNNQIEIECGNYKTKILGLPKEEFPKFPEFKDIIDLHFKLKKEYILIERSGQQTNIHNLSKPELLFLKYIKNNQNLYEIYQNISQEFPDFDIGSLMNKFISNGTIVNYEL